MAGIRFGSSTETTITIYMYDMQFLIRDYQAFRVHVTGPSGTTTRNHNFTANSRSAYHTITGLQPNTVYSIRVEAKPPANNQFWPVGGAVSTRTKARELRAPGNLRMTDKSHQMIAISWNRVSYASGYIISVNNSHEANTTSTWLVITGLEADKLHYIEVRAQDNDGNLGPTSTLLIYTDEMPDFTAPKIWNLSVTQRHLGQNKYSVHLSWHSSDDVAVRDHVVYRTPPDSTSYRQYESALSSNTKSVTVSTDGNNNVFLGGATYRFKVRVYDTSGNWSEDFTSIRLQDHNLKEWGWSYGINQNGPFYSQSGKDAHLMTAHEWNNFTNRINQTRTYKGIWGAWDFTTVHSGQEVTASIVLEAIRAINGMLQVSERMTIVSRGDHVTAKIFNDLASRLNIAIKRHGR